MGMGWQAVVPTRRVDDLALKGIETFDLDRLRIDERADRRDHEPRRHLPLAVDRQPPDVLVLVRSVTSLSNVMWGRIPYLAT